MLRKCPKRLFLPTEKASTPDRKERHPNTPLIIAAPTSRFCRMIEDRDYMRSPISAPNPGWSATVAVLVVNAAVFILQLFLVRSRSSFPFELYFGLSLEGIRHGFVWQLLSYQFLHANWLHLALNSWCIFVFGQAVELALGRRRFLQLYLVSGVVGGLAHILLSLVMPTHFGGVVVGASAGLYGLIAAFATLFPGQELRLLFPPIAVTARALAGVSAGIALVGLVWGIFQPGDRVAHDAHLGGMLAGFIYVRVALLTHRRF
jgi:membrane associated rhomboid family serine protease